LFLTSYSFLRSLPHNSRLQLEPQDWLPYALQDNSRHYTRNLIATDRATYTLLLLCWNPGQYSPIHDHPCDGCWMRVLHGRVRECRYKSSRDDEPDNGSGGGLVCTSDTTASAGDLVFIQDRLGYHKVGNPDPTQPAFTLHLYSPPIDRCRIWLDAEKDCSSSTECCNYSEYGEKL